MSLPGQLSDECQEAIAQFVQTREQNRDDLRRKKLDLSLLIAFVTLAMAAGALAAIGQYANATVQLVSSGVAFVAWWILRRERKTKTAAWLLVIAVQISAGVGATFSGFTSSPGIWFLTVPILAAVAFLGPKDVLVLSLLPFASLATLGGLESAYPSWVNASLDTGPARLITQLQLIFIFVFLSFTMTRLSERLIMDTHAQRLVALKQTQRAELENESKTRFLAKMSHELRTPLNGLLGMIQYLEGRSLGTHPRSVIARLRQRSEHILEHINDALDLAGIDSGDQPKRQESFDLYELANRVCELQTQGQASSGPKLKRRIELETRQVRGDGPRIRHLMATMLGTAMLHRCAQDVELSVTLNERAANDCADPDFRWLRMEVVFRAPHTATTGLLFAPPDPERSQPLAPGPEPHTCAGFSSAYRMAALLEGSFHVVRDKVDRVRCVASLPIRLPALAQDSFTRPAPARDNEHDGDAARKVLVVDDNSINLKVATLLLKRLGCEVDTAVDGQQAFEHAKRTRYDLIFMDLRMPNVDGYEATELILAELTPKAIAPPIVALTANAYQEDVEKVAASGMVAHVPKPVTIEKLVAALDQFAPRASREQASA